MRSILSVIAGVICWGVFWVTFRTMIEIVSPKSFMHNGVVKDDTIMILLLIFSFVCSVLSGVITAYFAEKKEMTHVTYLGVLLLIIETTAQVQVWDDLPLWYPTLLLLLLIPGNLIGGYLRVLHLKRKKIIP